MNGIVSKFLSKDEFPLVVEPEKKDLKQSEVAELLRNNSEFFKKNLLKYGGVLLRNFPICGADDFGMVIEAMDTGKFADYVGGDSPRKIIKRGIYTSTEAPPNIRILLHNELSYVNTYPTHIYFHCEIAPEAKGETIIADARKVYRSLDPDVRNRFIKQGLKYVSAYPGKNNFINKINKFHKTWMEVFETNSKAELENRCRQHGISFEWHDNDWVEITQIRPAAMPHPHTQEMVWFNQAHLYDFNRKFLGWWKAAAMKLLYMRKHTKIHQIFFADGSKVPLSDLYHIMDVLDQNTVYFPWKKGDILVLDNILSMHGRATFSGKRRILTAMTG